MLASVLLMYAHIHVYKCTFIKNIKIINDSINNKINISKNSHSDIIIIILGVNIKK